ncbi:TetR family transcriptional regulator [Novosphingobium sp. FGD1]|uniref:TetR family transcriptional regulator n=1 Tax=Novosphingobium silvae TaxID=2692619 RepID=A0A7X4GK45_9SPHN|nr:TetR family transcriptional regulator [Novosphingobium silvae]MYL99740.1 TetR family transcriptional regulator [Novosphingobium silvae]
MARVGTRVVEGNRVAARERLLEATSSLLSERDTLDVSLNEIAVRAGLNHGLVNYYFQGKDGLLLALLGRDAAQALRALQHLVEQDMPPLRKLELHVRGVINVYFRYPYINRLINVLQSADAENAKDLARIFIAPLQGFQKKIIDECRDAGEIEDVDETFFYYSVIGACEFIFHSRRTLPYLAGPPEITTALKDAYSDHLVRFVLDGLRIRAEHSA